MDASWSMRIAKLVSFSAVLLVAGSVEVRPCDCACDASFTVERYIDEASTIVVGRVLVIKPKMVDPGPKDDVEVFSSCREEWILVDVTETLKGTRSRRVTFLHSGACAFKFPLRVGEEYLLFGLGQGHETRLLSACTPSSPRSSAGSVIKQIRRQLGKAG